MEITGGEIKTNDTTVRAMGGTELMAHRILDSLGPDMLREFQIIFSRVRDLDETKCRLYYVHDLPGDPEADAALKDEGWKRFHRIIFVSNWQMQNFIMHYQIPYHKCLVMLNGINPIETHEKPAGPLRLGYWSTPHRGLNILVPVFEKLAEKHDIELDVFSSFSIYGWEERDEPFQPLFDRCKEHPKINYHGSVSNEEIREAVKNIHILAYPSTWVETSCLVLMEAMSARCLAVHSNLGALYETAANWTNMYQFHEDPNAHAHIFYGMLDSAIENYHSESTSQRLNIQKNYADIYYNWELRQLEWRNLLQSSVIDEDRTLPKDDTDYFVIKT